MRILHVSDLHIGKHKETLLDSLKIRVAALKPNLVLATGDFADQPRPESLKRASDYLRELAQQCSKTKGPPLIVVPGNHDMAYFGNVPAFKSAGKYSEVFGDLPTTAVYPDERVWIYGFNSAREEGMGANGQIAQDEFNLFDEACEQAAKEYNKDFESFYKIVALHHHPLPIRYSSKYSKWVMLLNAGEFLEQMLKHDIDLIVHGHEHVHAQATFGKRFAGRDKMITVISAGTVFHNEPGSDYNRFNIIQIAQTGQVEIESYEAKGGTFDAKPMDSYVARTTAESDAQRFDQIVRERGYKYTKLVARTELTTGGDVYRTVDFLDLDLKRSNCERATVLQISLPQTSGYIDQPTAWELDHGTEKQLVFHRKDTAAGDKRVDGIVEYGRTLPVGVGFSLRCKWWAINAMAMSKSQANRKYPRPLFEEYTHFPILDPVENLTCIVRFPPEFPRAARPEPFVARIDEKDGLGWHVEDRDAALEHQLRGSIVMDGPSATLQITKPNIGYTYGFRWILPEGDERDDDRTLGDTADLIDGLLNLRSAKDTNRMNRLSTCLGTIGEMLRESFAPGFNADLEFGLMIFDHRERKMVTVAAVRLTRTQVEVVNHDQWFLEYGEGIRGNAFKTKIVRLYVRPSYSHSVAGPHYYRRIKDGPDYAVLLALPMFHPNSLGNVYAVLSCGSLQHGCPIRELGTNGVPITRQEVKLAQAAASESLFKELKEILQIG